MYFYTILYDLMWVNFGLSQLKWYIFFLYYTNTNASALIKQMKICWLFCLLSSSLQPNKWRSFEWVWFTHQCEIIFPIFQYGLISPKHFKFSIFSNDLYQIYFSNIKLFSLENTLSKKWVVPSPFSKKSFLNKIFPKINWFPTFQNQWKFYVHLQRN